MFQFEQINKIDSIQQLHIIHSVAEEHSHFLQFIYGET